MPSSDAGVAGASEEAPAAGAGSSVVGALAGVEGAVVGVEGGVAAWPPRGFANDAPLSCAETALGPVRHSAEAQSAKIHTDDERMVGSIGASTGRRQVWGRITG